MRLKPESLKRIWYKLTSNPIGFLLRNAVSSTLTPRCHPKYALVLQINIFFFTLFSSTCQRKILPLVVVLAENSVISVLFFTPIDAPQEIPDLSQVGAIPFSYYLFIN